MKFLVLFVLILFGLHWRSQRRISNLEKGEFGLEKQLKIFNKAPVKSFQDEDGSILDCIEINKQPAFDHPLLKNHKIQMRPSSLPKEIPNTLQQAIPKRQNKEKCPRGTVLIRRTTVNDLVAARTLSYQYRQNSYPLASKYFGFHFSMAKTAPDTSKKYYGAAAKINVRNVKVLDDQFSEASIWIQNSLDNQTNNIQFGWTINPRLFGDNHTRSFAYWTADGYQSTGCFNSLCPGFVQISGENYLGQILPVSEYGGDAQYVLDGLIFKDPKTGNWWMAHGTKHGREFIGYWPKSIFTTMAESASEIQFGGKAYSPSNEPAPPMGSGHFHPDDFSRTCFISNIQLVDSSAQLYEPKNTTMLEITDNPSCYPVKYKGYTGDSKRYAVVFGGRGGATCNA